MKQKEYFTCVDCGEEKKRSDKPSTHKAHGVDECNDCYSARKGAEMVEKCRKKRAEHEERLLIQQQEREAKRAIFEEAKQPRRVRFSTETKKRRNEIEFKRELQLINEGLEL